MPEPISTEAERPVMIDSNVLIYAISGSHPSFSPRCRELLLRMAAGEFALACAATAIFETIHIIHKRNGMPRIDAAATLLELITLPAFLIDQRQAVITALEFWVDQPALDFADCYHLALTRSLGLDAIYTFDKKMDRYPGITRLEP